MKAIKRIWIKYKIISKRLGGKTKKGRPQGSSQDVDTALRIWSRVILNKDSDLLYNPVNGECIAEGFDVKNPLYIFLESDRLRIINTVIGYDVILNSEEESWCEEIFRREVNRRRYKFKQYALGKVVHSLDDLEERLIQSEISLNN